MEIGGKTYDYYAVTQKMRSMERGVRALKKEREALRAMNLDTKEIDRKISQRTEAYKDFCKAAKVKEKTERLRYECSKENLKHSKAWREMEKQQDGFAKTEEDDTLMAGKEEKGVEVHTIGRINKNIYKCVTEDIVTDEVIITDERITHIKERHPNDYERFFSYIPDIIGNPDYIIEATKPNTAVILKEIENQGEKFKLVLRLKVKNDPAEYKNSIMTFWHIGETTWRKSLKNKLG